MEQPKISVRDMVWIATLVVTVAANWFSQQRAIDMLSNKLESQAVQQELRRVNDKEIMKLELRSVELRLQRLEQAIQHKPKTKD